jgi:hypothetical protein
MSWGGILPTADSRDGRIVNDVLQLISNMAQITGVSGESII